MRQDVRFCRTSDQVRIAYATTGDGPPLVKAAHWLSHLEFDWQSPIWSPFLRALSRQRRLIRYDQRGCGLSDREVEELSVEAWVRDLEAVVDAVGLDRFALMGLSQSGPVAVTYAVRHPERVSRMILYGTYGRGWANRGTPDAIEEREAMIALTRRGWGRDIAAYRQLFTSTFAPDATEEQASSFNELQRISASPEGAVRFQRAFSQINVVDILSEVTVPTLVLHARDDVRCPFEEGVRVAAGIPDSRFVALDSRNHILLEQDPAFRTFLREIDDFLGTPSDDAPVTAPAREPSQRELVTVLFADIVASTVKAAELGDRKWTDLLGSYRAVVRQRLGEHRGREVDTAGDGLFAVFDSPASAIRCARHLAGDARRLGIEIRSGIHAGECERRGNDYSGIAVHVGARVMAAADASETLVSETVAQLVTGSELALEDRGVHDLKGVPGRWRLFRVNP